MKKHLFAVGLLAVFCGRAAAMHPLITEDTGFLGKGGRQAEIGYEYSAAEEGTDVYSRSLAAEVSCGLNDRTDLLLTVPFGGWSSAGTSEDGLGDLALDAKFQVAEKAGWAFALKPGLSLPTGDDKKGLGAGKSAYWVYGVAGRASGAWQYYVNAGYLLNKNKAGEKEDILKASAAAAYEVMEKTLLSVDLAYETNADPAAASHPLSSVFGIVWSPKDTLDLDVGVKAGLNDAADDLGLLAGATFRF
ncbi:MAG TPA: transporter [Elusimicrobiales bacterium]|nr:transporter [Elusimicrobiales bacterium]